MTDKKEMVDRILKKVIQSGKKINPADYLVEDLGLSSLKLMEIMGYIEDELDVIIPVNKVINIKTVQDLYQAVENIDEFIK